MRTQGPGVHMLPQGGLRLHLLPKAQTDAMLTLTEMRALQGPVYVSRHTGVIQARDRAGNTHLIDHDGTLLLRPYSVASTAPATKPADT